jgi:hypothetical protein
LEGFFIYILFYLTDFNIIIHIYIPDKLLKNKKAKIMKDRQRIDPESGRFQVEEIGFFGPKWIDINPDATERVNPETGVVEVEQFGLLGTSWTVKNEDSPTRVNPDTGIIEEGSYGFFGNLNWAPKNEDNPTRLNPETGEIESLSYGIAGSSWSTTDGDQDRVNPQTGVLQGRNGLGWVQDDDNDVVDELDLELDLLDDDDE